MGIQANSKTKSVEVSNYLDPSTVQFLDVTSRNEVIAKLSESLVSCYSLSEYKDEFIEAVLEREAVASTGIGLAVALPHAKLSSFDDFFIAVGVLKKGINWNAMDNIDVRLVFLIGGPDDKQCDYLNLLSDLTTSLRDEGIRKRLLNATNPKQIIETFQLTPGSV